MVEKLSAKPRRINIAKQIQKNGVWSLNKSEIARQYGVSDTTIRKDIHKILQELPQEDILEIAYELRYYFRELIQTARNHLDADNPHISLQSVNALTKTIKEFTVFLEAFGYKDKVAAGLNINLVDTEKSLINTIRKNAHQNDKTVLDYMRGIMPDEISGNELLKKWVNEDDDDIFDHQGEKGDFRELKDKLYAREIFNEIKRNKSKKNL